MCTVHDVSTEFRRTIGELLLLNAAQHSSHSITAPSHRIGHIFQLAVVITLYKCKPKPENRKHLNELA